MGENMVSDVSVQVLTERVSAVLDDIKEMKGKVDAMHIVTTRLTSLEKDVVSVDKKAEVALAKTDRLTDAITTLKETVITPMSARIDAGDVEDRVNRRWWKTVMACAIGVPAMLTTAGFIWKPWQPDVEIVKTSITDKMDGLKRQRDADLKQYSQDVGKELQNDDRRLTVLEFRTNNLDHKGSK